MTGRDLVVESPYVWRARGTGAGQRLVCLPHAGAGAAVYAPWAQLLPPEIDLVAVQLPGRQNRITEAAFTDVGQLVNVLVHALRPVLDQPFSFFGHSCGATLAYELAIALRSRDRRGPDQLFLSSPAAPDAENAGRMHLLADEEFLSAIIDLGGIDREIAEDDDAMRSLLPILRADYALWELHCVTPAPPLDCPIAVLAGQADSWVRPDDVAAWRQCTSLDFTARYYPGGHFYLKERPADVVAFIATKMLHSGRR